MNEFDVAGQINYWKADALGSWDDARYLLDDKRVTLGLFAVHLALEKILKAQIIKETGALAPKIHDLIRLSQLGNLKLSGEQVDFLGQMNFYAIHGRYIGASFPIPTQILAKEYLQTAKEIILWLAEQL